LILYHHLGGALATSSRASKSAWERDERKLYRIFAGE